ncbi:MAG: valine--tRNA ligase [Candidatus Daviesbacteria bacterium]|nr:valine--tRNA ligase [Candidatus Daviesbacteria bacterium]
MTDMTDTQDKSTESTIYQLWEKQGLFKTDPDSTKPSYSLLMPPPNLTGELHLGHAMQHAIMDAIARFKRMQGFDVLLLPGVDHAGIQFEGTFNKLLAKEDLSKQKLGREEWLKRAEVFREENYQSFHKTWTVFGLSADWSKEVYTLEPKVQKAVFAEFETFWEQDLLYKGAYIVQWCPKCGTAIEDLEMEYQERKEKLYFVKYRVIAKDVDRHASARDDDDDQEYITVATARPETIYADTGIAIYPKHPKFSKLVGKTAINPLTGNLIPIFEDPRVDKEFGTGALKITPGHDLLDYEIGKEHSLPILHVIDKKGRMTNLAPLLEGLKIDEAREKTVQLLETKTAIAESKEFAHSVPVCERCKTTVEPLISEEWFIKMEPLAKKALKHIGQIKFYPGNYNKILSDWLENIHDWCISRSLWWGIRIPVWYCQKCNPNHLVGKDKDMVVSKEEPGKTCQSCSEKHWVQDEQIFDAWFSSGMWPLATLGWPENTPELQRYYPWDFELTSPEIKFLWIARMIMLSLWFEDKIPFKNMFFHGMLRDLQGRKFSKSLGNGINPGELRDQWGTDSTRMALYSYSVPGRDAKASRQTMDERCKNFRNFGTKLKNIYRFTMELKPEVLGMPTSAPQSDVIARSQLAEKQSHADDKLILNQLNNVVLGVTKNLEDFNLHLALDEIYEFIWHQLADVYIEKSKARRAQAQPCLEQVLEICLKLLHPFMPFTTEELWQKIPHTEKSIMLAKWPIAR